MKQAFVAISVLFLLACGQAGAPVGSPNFTTVTSAEAFEGFAENVTGGQGYGNVHVTNLNDSGAGSLRTALGSNRVIVFDVGGTITLATPLSVNYTNLTIDGFTATGNGITLTGPGDIFQIHGNYTSTSTTGSNIIIRGLRIRTPGGDGFQVAYFAHHIVLDHNSVDSAGDGAIDITNSAHHVTVSWNIMSNTKGAGASLNASNAGQISSHHNIFYNNGDRNPIMVGALVDEGGHGPTHADPMSDARYNLIYEYGIGNFLLSDQGGVATGNIVGNLYKARSNSNQSNNINRSRFQSNVDRAHAYVASNISVHDCRGTAYHYGEPGDGLPDSAFVVTSANMQGDMGSAYTVPAITGPSASTQQGMIDMWANVKATAGLITYFPDDSVDSATRSAIIIPSVSIYSQPWNSDAVVITGGPKNVTPVRINNVI